MINGSFLTLSHLLLASPGLGVLLLWRSTLESSHWRVGVDNMTELLYQRGQVVGVSIPRLQVGQLHHILLP